MKAGDDYLMRWQNEYWLVYITSPFAGRAGVSAGNRPSATAFGFANRPFGPYPRPEDTAKPHAERRYDHYVDNYVKRMTRDMLSEATLLELRWQGLPLEEISWVDPPPHGERLRVCINPIAWSMFARRDKVIEGIKDITHIPLELLNAPEEYFQSLVPMLRANDWKIYDWRMQGLGAYAAKPINELELIEIPWPKDMIEGIKD